MTALVTVAPGHQLAPGPAASYLRALAAGCPAGITSSYRDPARQAAMRAAYLAARARGEHPAFVAAVEASEHVTGYALDLPSGPRAWMRANPDYGFVFTDPTEAWHVAYRLDRDRHLTDGITPPAPITPTTPEDPMLVLSNTKTKMAALIFGDGTWSLIHDAAAAASLRAALPGADVDDQTWSDACQSKRKRA